MTTGTYRNQLYRQLPISSRLPHINSNDLYWFLDNGKHFETLEGLKSFVDAIIDLEARRNDYKTY